MIWKQKAVTTEGLNNFGLQNMPGHLRIEFIEVGDDFLIAKMPVDERTKQPMGLLHGGASAALAETMGSVASVLCIDDITKQSAVGVEINANHLRAARSGFVYGRVSPIKIGRTIHVWRIQITDENQREICESRLTTMIIDRKTS